MTVSEMVDEKQVAQQGGGSDSSKSVTRLGLVLSELNDEQKKELQVKGGLIVEDARGAAAHELQHGDVILAIGNTEISSLAQFNEVLKHLPKGSKVALLVRHEDFTSYIVLKLDEKQSKDKE